MVREPLWGVIFDLRRQRSLHREASDEVHSGRVNSAWRGKEPEGSMAGVNERQRGCGQLDRREQSQVQKVTRVGSPRCLATDNQW